MQCMIQYIFIANCTVQWRAETIMCRPIITYQFDILINSQRVNETAGALWRIRQLEKMGVSTDVEKIEHCLQTKGHCKVKKNSKQTWIELTPPTQPPSRLFLETHH